jgi:hypothetical protein
MAELVDRDEEHIRLLALFHYVAAGVTFVLGSFPLIHVTIGVVFMLISHFAPPGASERETPPMFIGAMLATMGGAFVAAGWTLAVLHYFTARFLKQRRRYTFCLLVSAFSSLVCMFTTGVVSVATIIVLVRPRVREMFGEGGSATPKTVQPQDRA